MSVVGFKAKNHPQQVDSRGALDEVDDRGTHPDDFNVWDERFGGFTLDAAAAPHNAKVAKFFTRADNGLEQSWAGERVWCNPPYSDLYSWVAKAWKEHQTTRGIVMLLPANRVEQKWWQELVEPYRDRDSSPLHVEFLKGRLRFIKAGQTEIGPNERPPFGCALLIWDDPSEDLPAYCSWCNRVPRGRATWQGDDTLYPSCGLDLHGLGFIPDVPIAAADFIYPPQNGKGS